MTNNLVCLCGSTRFLAEFEEANIELSKRGMSVLTISMALPKNDQGTERDVALKELLDLVHLNKISRSDVVLVVGDGYIGRSTAREILWADMQGKSVVELHEYRMPPDFYDYSLWDNVVPRLRASRTTPTGIIIKARKVLGL